MNLIKRLFCNHDYRLVKKITYSQLIFVREGDIFIGKHATIDNEHEIFTCTKCEKLKRKIT